MPGGEACTTVEAAIEQFLAEALTPAQVDADRLEAFAQAWTRHDIDALMSFMADDCVFHASAGPDASGTRYIGRDAVRAGFVKAWTDFPDAQWTRARHFVQGVRGVSEWTFVGTRASDGIDIGVRTPEAAVVRLRDLGDDERRRPAAHLATGDRECA